jgi:hypothetical protein
MTKQYSLARSVRLRLPLLASFLAALMVLPVHATTMQLYTVEELAGRSSDVFYGQVISTETNWNADRTRIYTSVQVRIDETFKGSVRRSEIVTVTQFGGEMGGVRWDYLGRPVFSQGETVVLFTTRMKNNNLIVVGLKQGKMNVVGGEVKRDLSGITFVERTPDGRGFRQTTVRPQRMTLAELRNRIARTR